MTKLLTQDRYDRSERTVLGDFNGVEMILAYGRWGDEKFRLAIPLLGVAREINYSGFIPDFSQAAMTAFKGKIFETVSPDFAKAYENSLADMDRQAKKMSADADRLQKDYEGMRGDLIKLRARQAQLEREVTPLVVQAVADRSVAAYGNWLIAKPGGGQYVARRESDAKSLSAPTVKELIPLMDAEDFASPRSAAIKTTDLRSRLKPDSNGEAPMVDRMPVADVDFDTPEMDSTRREYDAVVARYTNADGSRKAGWMKAPNGKPTKLTERQWVQVRTPAFKKWFGDWENVELQEWLEDNSVATATGNEYSGLPKAELEDAIVSYFADKGIKSVENKNVGKVNITRSGIHDSIAKGVGRMKIAAFNHLPEIITNGRIVAEEANWKRRGYNTVTLAAPIEIADKKHVALVTVRQYPNRDNNFYLHEVGLLDEIKREAERLYDTGLSQNGDKEARPLGSMRNIAKSLFAVNPAAVSKVVDENGEPLVLRRRGGSDGTPHESAWVDLWITPSLPDSAKEEVAKTFGEIHRSPYGDSFYDSADISWTHKPDRSLRLANHWNFKTGYDSAVHCPTDRPVENTRKWALAEYHAEDGVYHVLKTWDALGRFARRRTYFGNRFDTMVADWRNRTADGVLQLEREAFDRTRSAYRESGLPDFDAFLQKYHAGEFGDLSSQFFFNSQNGQVKSATGNAGTFDAANPDIDFDSPELSPAEQAYAEAEDKTPTEKVMREVYGMTNDEIATALKAAGMEPPKHVRKTDETAWKQAEALLSNPSYMAKLSRAVAKFPRNIADYENNALNVLFRRRQAAVNAAQEAAAALKKTLDGIDAIPKGERDADYGESLEAARREYGEAASRLAQAKALMHETGFALTRSSSEAGRRLRSNRGLIDQTDLSYAGISGRMATALGGADKITPEMDAKIREIAGEFASLDEEGRDLATVRLKALAEKIVEQIKRGDKVRKATERKQGDEAKRVMRNYNDALAQIEVGAAEVGGTLVGLSDQQYPAWGKWLRAIGEFHCFENPDITEEECVRAIVEDISPFMDGVDENQVRDALTGFGHNFRQSRYDAQRLMNDLRSQARLKRQMDWMDETNTMPPLTGMVRDEPSDTTRNLKKQVQERKKEVPDAGRDERRLKGVLESAKTRVKNSIADLERAIETRERIPGRDRTVPEDIELRELKKRRDALQQSYDELFKTERGLTDEQRVKLAERLLGRELEHALEDLDRARSGDFSKRPKRPGVESPSIDALRDRLNDVREQIRELKAAKYEFGMTPEELDAYNARKMANREKVLMRLAERIMNGDLRQQKKPQPPMPPEMQKRYDAMGEQMKKARQKLADMRLEAEDATLPSFWRKGGDYLRFVTTAQRALRATMDFSAVLRQAARITFAHPVMGAKAFGKAWNAAHSEANLLAVNDEIMSDPSIQEAVAKYGLHLREVDATSARDVEMFHGMERNRVRIFGKEVSITDIPFFGEFMLKSERHYITYLNAVSAELYSSIVNDRTRFPAGPTAWQKKMVADMINVWNGSAALSKERRQALQKALVNDFLWAPQLAISRIQSAALYDVWHPLVAKGVKNAETGAFDAVSDEERKTMFKIGASEHFKSSLAMHALGALLKWLFADEDDWYDFWQADWFEKLLMLASPKIGNTTIDLTGGEQIVYRAAHKIWKLATSGKVRTGSGKMAEMGSHGGPTVWGVIGRYLQGKASPWLSELVSLIEGRDYVGNEYTWKDAAMGAAVPLTFEDVKEQLEQNGIGKSLITIPLSLLGASGSTYDRKAYENAVNRFLESKKEYDAIEQDPLIDKENKKLVLDSIVAENPLMEKSIRVDVAARIEYVKNLESKVRKAESGGRAPSADFLATIKGLESEIIEKIRAARRR